MHHEYFLNVKELRDYWNTTSGVLFCFSGDNSQRFLKNDILTLEHATCKLNERSDLATALCTVHSHENLKSSVLLLENYIVHYCH